MNIQEATRQIEGAVRAYLARDEHGNPLIPQPMQRPLMLMGPPGVGKTAVVGQVAERLHLNFVSYSITHHTRQSALGLPYITEATYGGKAYRVSRYTMSEIIAATYDAMEASGVGEGILFLDEVNCVSETLAPAMLQFLQYKAFGQHRLPEGWVVVCAGNPPEYNRSAREFDPAMLDRLKRIDVEPDLDVWMGYATEHGVHPAVTTYLRSKPDAFFRIRSTVDGTRMVTARGWEDLSRMLVALEHEGLEAGRELVGQYLQDPDVAEDFALYLGLFRKYRDTYRVGDILAGTVAEQDAARVGKAPFDERLALVGLLVSALASRTHDEQASEEALRRVREDVVAAGERIGGGAAPADALRDLLLSAEAELARAREQASSSDLRLAVLAERSELLHRLVEDALAGEPDEAMGALRGGFNARLGEVASQARELSGQVDNAVAYLEAAFGNGEELLVFCTRLSCDATFMAFVSAYGAPRFVEASKGLMLHDRERDLLEEARGLAGAPGGDRSSVSTPLGDGMAGGAEDASGSAGTPGSGTPGDGKHPGHSPLAGGGRA